MPRHGFIPLALLITLLLSACSAQQLYHSGQDWQRNECRKISDASERSRCLQNAATSYDQYQRESQAVGQKAE